MDMGWTGKDKRADILTLDLGVMPVGEAERVMRTAATLRVQDTIPDLLLFLAHPPTVSLGLKNKAGDQPTDLLVPVSRLAEEGIELVKSRRGGGITYHWPGQVVTYPVIKLDQDERNLPLFMARLERVAADTLKSFGIETDTRRDTPAHIGLWWEDRKVVSMGICVDHWVTGFGFALNLDGDHAPSRYVRPCGIAGAQLVTVREILGAAPPRPWVIQMVRKSFAGEFKRRVDAGGSALSRMLGANAVASAAGAVGGRDR